MTESTAAVQRILVVEDEAQIRRFLRISLEAHRFAVEEARLGEHGLVLARTWRPDLVVLDLGLPDIDGQEFISRLREWSAVPIIVLSVRADEGRKVAALDAGANDYVTKPFGISELMARIRVLLRQSAAPAPERVVLSFGDLAIDLATRRVVREGVEVGLAKKEYELLHLFATHSDQVLTHKQILTAIWGPKHTADTHYLRVLVGHLREKIGDDPAHPRHIVTVQGVGYRFGGG